ncbi:MAG: hypothetical protein JWM68_3172 [Verrucomicrobiales bacterium]|nr:hypothetical protein [Verrucomicrobiales bacterium]
MNDSNIQKLLAAARKEQAPEVPFNFENSVVSAIRRDQRRSTPLSFFEQLNQLFPRLAAAAVVIIGLCIATEFYFTQSETTTTADVQQAAEEWLFASN